MLFWLNEETRPFELEHILFHLGAREELQLQCGHLPSNLLYKPKPIPKLKCFSYRLAVVFAKSIETRC